MRKRIRVALPLTLVLAAALSACIDQNDVTAPTIGPSFSQGRAQSTGPSALELIETDYEGGLLSKDNANRYRQYAVLAPEKLPPRYRTVGVGKDATFSMVQLAKEFNELSPAAKSDILDLQAKGFGDLKNTFETEHFILHYATLGVSAVPPLDANSNGVPDYIEVAAESWETVWNREVNQLGYPAPKGTPEQKFHVYYKQLPYYGYAMPTNVELLAVSPVPYGTASAFIVIENDFYGFPRNDEDPTGTEVIRSGALKVTQAHEFMHALQFNINVYGSGWLMESHATWAEDAVYDGINDWHWYINLFLQTPDFPLFNRYLYGAAFFQHWLSETKGVDIQRQIWFAHQTSTAANAIRDVAFGGSWEAIKEFAAIQYLLDISDFTQDPTSVIPRPRNFIRASHDSYPVSVAITPSTNKVANRAPWGLGSNFVDFMATASGKITLTFDGTDGFAWRAYAIATPRSGGPDKVISIALDAGAAGTVTINGFGTKWSKVTLAPTIADRPGMEVPYQYSATLTGGGVAD